MDRAARTGYAHAPWKGWVECKFECIKVLATMSHVRYLSHRKHVPGRERGTSPWKGRVESRFECIDSNVLVMSSEVRNRW